MTSMIGATGMRSSTGSSAGQNMTGNMLPKGYKMGQIQRFDPDTMNLFKQLFGHVGPDSFLSKLARGDQSMFEQMEAPAMRQFQGLQGQIASRFSGMGMGGRRSSGFQNTMNQASQDFASQLHSQRMGIQNQAIQDLFKMSNMLMQQSPYEQFMIKQDPKQSWWQRAAGVGLPIAGAVAGGIFGGPAGAAMGGQLGGSIASGFSGSPSQANYQGIGDLPTKWS